MLIEGLAITVDVAVVVKRLRTADSVKLFLINEAVLQPFIFQRRFQEAHLLRTN